MFEYSVESILVSLGYAGVFLMMIANGAISFPSSQILYILAGFFASTGDFNFFLISFIGALGNTIGNIILYEVSRSKGLKYVTRYRLFPPREVKKVQVVFNKHGSWFLFLGKLLPAIKVFVPIPAGIAKMNRVVYFIIILITSWLWSFVFLAIGYFFGKSAGLFGVYGFVLFIIAFIVVSIFYKYMNSDTIIKEIEKLEKNSK